MTSNGERSILAWLAASNIEVSLMSICNILDLDYITFQETWAIKSVHVKCTGVSYIGADMQQL